MTDRRKIWDALMALTGNAYGAAGLMGNLYAESALRPNNLQNTYERRLGMTDEVYTEAVDHGIYQNFGDDRAGYGISQWTQEKRKKRLLAFARERGSSIGDLDMQLAFMQQEMRDSYRIVLEGLMYAKGVREASDLVLAKYENPTDQSDAVKEKRARYGEQFYAEFAAGPRGIKRGDRGDAVKEIQRLLNDLGDGLDVDGIYGEKTETAVRRFQADAGLEENGVCGGATLEALRKASNHDAHKLLGGGDADRPTAAERLREIAARLTAMADEMEARTK